MDGMTDLLAQFNQTLDLNDLIEVASALIAIESHRDVPGRERACAEKMAEIFGRWGMQAELVPVFEERPNVYCTLKGSGSGMSLMLNGHTDTVPAFGMTIPPFKPMVKEGLLFGRGSVDMKGALASMMVAMRLLKDLDVPHGGDIVFAGVINEEDRSEGSEHLVRNGPHTDRCVVGEPTGLEVKVGHRGLEWLEFEFIGKAAHGGAPHKGINAINMAARFVCRVEEKLVPRLAKRVYPLTGPAVMNFGVIRGGTQPSSVADHCIVQLDRRWIPTENLAQVLSEYQEILDELSVEDTHFQCKMSRMESNMATMDHYPMEIALDDPLVTGLKIVLESLGIQPKVSTFGGWTDGSLLSNFAHIPSLVFGPGDISVAHSPVEFVPVAELRTSALAYALLAASITNRSL
jgi:acetylornithine deacetylase/succinyl-diaminopimelate desuccinylase family protein